MLLLSPLSHFISLSLSNFFLLLSALSSSNPKPIQFQHFLPLYLRSVCFHQKKNLRLVLLWIPMGLLWILKGLLWICGFLCWSGHEGYGLISAWWWAGSNWWWVWISMDRRARFGSAWGLSLDWREGWVCWWFFLNRFASDGSNGFELELWWLW